jgi:hypothetical protein
LSQLANITKVPLLPVITIQKTSGVFTYNPFISTFDFAVGSLSVSPAFDAVGGTFSLQIIGSSGTNAQMNTILSNISEGNEVTIWIGKSNATKTKIFLGIIEDIEIVEPNKNFMIVTLSGPDFGSDILKNTVVNFQYEQRLTALGEVDTTDTSTTIINLVNKILNDTQSYPVAAVDSITAVTKGIVYDATKVLPLDYQIPIFNARYDFLDDKLQELDDYGLSYHYVDADKNFIMSQLNVSTSSAPATILFTDDINDSTTWVSGKVGLIAPNSNFKRTLEHHKRRVFGLGGLSSVLDQQNTTTTSNSTMASVYKAQRFTPTKTTLSKINLYLSIIGTPTSDLVLELRDDSASGTSLPIGEVRRSISKNKNILSTFGTTATIVSFEMNEELTPGRNYWIVLMQNGTDASNCFRWHKDALDTGTSATSTDDVTWGLTTTPNRFNYAFQAFLGNELIAVSTEANTVVSSKHFHEDTIRKSDIINNALLKILLLQENKTVHKKKEILKCMIYAPDTLLSTGQKIRVRKQLSGYVIDGDFTLGQIEYVFESGEDTSTGNFYYNVELTRFVDFA